MEKEVGDRSSSSDTECEVHFSPVITLPEVAVPTNEEEEELVLKVRARLYRFDKNDDIPEWKERGTGELKMLKHNSNKTVRVVMRRDKTLKVCANHFVTPLMELKPKAGLDKVFIYKVFGEFSSEEIRSECLAVKFGSVDVANQFKKAFQESQEFVRKECKLYNGTLEEEDDEEDEDTEKESDCDEDGESAVGDSTKLDGAADEVAEQLKSLKVAKANGN